MPSLRLDLRGLPAGRAPDRDALAGGADAAGAGRRAARCPRSPASSPALLQAGRTRRGAGRLGTGRRRRLRPRWPATSGWAPAGGASCPWSATTTAACCCTPAGSSGAGGRTAGRCAAGSACRPTTTTSKVADGYVHPLDAAPGLAGGRPAPGHRGPRPLRPARRSRAGRCRSPATRPGSSATACRTRARSPGWTWYADDRVRWRLQPLSRGPRGGLRPAPWTLGTPARRGGPAAAVLSAVRVPRR